MSQWILIAGCGMQLFFWIAFAFGFRRAHRTPERDTKNHTGIPATPEPISIIIAVRNEAENLPGLIRALDQQSFSPFEVIIVDDDSEDDTVELAENDAESRPWLRLIQQKSPEFPRKKRALMVGIEAAHHDLLAFTDADCRPGPEWLSEISRVHADRGPNTIVVGHAVFSRTPGLLNALARYVSLLTTFQAAATIGLGMPFMAFGTNLSYRRQTFREVGGYGDGMASLSGDDDLFVQRVAGKRAATIVWMGTEESIVMTTAQKSWGTWFRQKMRHHSAGRFFAPRIKIAGLLYWVSMAVVAAATMLYSWIAGVAWILVHALCIGNAFCLLRAKDLILRLPILVPLYFAIQVLFPVAGFFKPQKTWK